MICVAARGVPRRGGRRVEVDDGRAALWGGVRRRRGVLDAGGAERVLLAGQENPPRNPHHRYNLGLD